MNKRMAPVFAVHWKVIEENGLKESFFSMREKAKNHRLH
jgi:hypothetical protein